MADESGLTMDQRFGLIVDENKKLQQQGERPRQLCVEIQRLRTPSPKIQRVPHHLRAREDHFAKHYLPKMVSFGPIHHGEANLQLGERYKLMWLAMYVNSTRQNARDLHKRIADSIKELKDLFDKDLFDKDKFTNYVGQGFKDLDEKLSWMLFVDGCSLLQILENGNLGEDYDYHKLNLKIDQLILVQRDMLLLENQLPYPVLRLLSCHENVDAKLLEIMDKFLRTHHLWPGKKENKDPNRPSSKKDNLQQERKVVLQPPVHVLDHLRRTILGDRFSKEDRSTPESMEITYRNIHELKASGIELKKNHSHSPKAIEFSAGELRLPQITVDDTTAPTFLNLIAYEMCPDFQNDYGISSFVVFLDSLIDHPDDVKHLRKKKILRNALGSDEEVSELFNTISRDLVTSVESYSEVRIAIEQHYRNKCKTWMAEAWRNHFRSPWTIMGLFAAIVALVLTFIQTWYSIKGS